MVAALREAESICRDALAGPELADAAAALERAEITQEETLRAVAAAHESDPGDLARIRGSLAAQGFPVDDGRLERLLLLRAALVSLPGVPALPIGNASKELFRDAFAFFATPGEPQRGGFVFRIGHPHFASMCKIASLRRFPAGQFDWEVSGFLRSWLLAVRPRALPRLLRTLALEVGGLRPLFAPHYSVCRRHRLVLREEEVNGSYLHIAEALERQPGVRGFVACSWFFSEEIHRVSPHLSWLNRVFDENGAFRASVGLSSPESGFLQGSPRRRELYERGEFRPRDGLVLWPRQRMLAWARGARAPGT